MNKSPEEIAAEAEAERLKKEAEKAATKIETITEKIEGGTWTTEQINTMMEQVAALSKMQAEILAELKALQASKSLTLPASNVDVADPEKLKAEQEAKEKAEAEAKQKAEAEAKNQKQKKHNML